MRSDLVPGNYYLLDDVRYQLDRYGPVMFTNDFSEEGKQAPLRFTIEPYVSIYCAADTKVIAVSSDTVSRR